MDSIKERSQIAVLQHETIFDDSVELNYVFMAMDFLKDGAFPSKLFFKAFVPPIDNKFQDDCLSIIPSFENLNDVRFK